MRVEDKLKELYQRKVDLVVLGAWSYIYPLIEEAVEAYGKVDHGGSLRLELSSFISGCVHLLLTHSMSPPNFEDMFEKAGVIIVV